MYFDSIDALRNAFPSSIPTNGEYIVAGYYKEGDDGGGTFVWVPITSSPLQTDNYGTFIQTDITSHWRGSSRRGDPCLNKQPVS